MAADNVRCRMLLGSANMRRMVHGTGISYSFRNAGISAMPHRARGWQAHAAWCAPGRHVIRTADVALCSISLGCNTAVARCRALHCFATRFRAAGNVATCRRVLYYKRARQVRPSLRDRLARPRYGQSRAGARPGHAVRRVATSRVVLQHSASQHASTQPFSLQRRTPRRGTERHATACCTAVLRLAQPAWLLTLGHPLRAPLSTA